MARLKNRQLQIPNGMTFYLPPLKWRAPRGSSFNSICNQLEHLVAANQALARKHQWPTTRSGIEDWVELYNAELCLRMGWTSYIQEEGGQLSAPKVKAPSHQLETLRSLKNAAVAAKAMVAGAKTLDEYLESNEPAVAPELSAARASVCAQCPKNEQGDFTRWFTVPASEYIRRQIEKAQNRKLSTPRDDELNLCVACNCPMKLKVHIPIDWIVKRLPPEHIQQMRQGKNCWILSEGGI